MQHNINQFYGQIRFFARISAIFFLAVVFGVSLTVSAQADSAQLRLGHFVFDGTAVSLYVDGEVMMTPDGEPALFYPMTLPSAYLDFATGTHTLALAAEGDTLDAALIGEQEFTLEAGHRYMVAFLGNVSADDLHVSLIDETAAIDSKDINLSAVSIIINNLAGLPALDGTFAGQPFFSDLAYGDYAVTQDPTTGSGSLITAQGNPDVVILEVAEAVGSPAHFFAVFAFSGTFSGAQWDGYTALYTGQFEGELTLTDGGAITVGDSLPATFTDMGQRVRFTLTLDAPAVLDIMMTGEAGTDAFLRMYDTAGNLIHENDEFSMDDNDAGIGDAGWVGLSLDAGTYILEAATFVDIGTGTFTLSVSPAK